MFRSLRLVSFLSFAALAAVSTACRDTGSGDDTNIDAPGPDSTQGGLTIPEIHADAMVPGTPVDLKGKVVVAIDNFGARKGNFWIAEEAGGEFSGVLVFGAPVDQVALLAVGDKVDISGAEKVEFALTADTSGRTTTELQPVSGGAMTVTKVGTGTVPAPHAIDALAIGQMAPAARDAELEKWEGVRVTVSNVTVTSALRQITSSTQDDCTFRDFGITGGMKVDSSLAAIPANLPMTAECPATGETSLVVPGDCITSVSGVMDYFFDWKILPTATSDIGATGGTCPVENTEALCMDTVDNDGNGFADCMDNACTAFCSTGSTTIAMVQTGAATGVVTLDDVIVSAVDLNGATNMGFYVQQSAQAAANEGLLIFTGATMPTVTIGQHVSVTGMVKEFDSTTPAVGDTLTEIANPVVTPVAGITTPLPLAGIAVATLKDISTVGEPYESVLVTLTNMKVMSNAVGNDRIQLSNGTDTIVMDDDVFNYTAADYPVNTCFGTVTGVMGLNTFDDERRIFPRSAADLVAGTSCP